jgi:hypothetical protein
LQKPLFFLGEIIARILPESPFFLNFMHTNPSTTRCYLACNPEHPRPVSPSP